MKAIMITFYKDKKAVVAEINEVKKIVKDVVICNKFFNMGTDRIIFDFFHRIVYIGIDHICLLRALCSLHYMCEPAEQ